MVHWAHVTIFPSEPLLEGRAIPAKGGYDHATLFKPNPLFGIVSDSHAVVRDNAKRFSVPFAQFFPNDNVFQSCGSQTFLYIKDL